MEHREDAPEGGDFAKGEETLPHEEHVGSFAEGEETLEHDEHRGSFAEGEETLPEDEREGSFADTDEDVGGSSEGAAQHGHRSAQLGQIGPVLRSSRLAGLLCSVPTMYWRLSQRL